MVTEKDIAYIDKDGVPVAASATAWKTPYNHSTEYEASRYATVNTEPSMTQQSQAEDADINTIVRRFGLTGRMKDIPMPPSVAEYSEIFDLHSAMNVVARAKASFLALPPDVRNTFNGSPENFVAYVDEAVSAGDLDQLREWGLAVPAAPPPPETPIKGSEEPTT